MSKIYLTDQLSKNDYSKEVHKQLIKQFNEYNIQYEEISGGNIWCKDYMSVKGSDDVYVKFRYFPDYNRGTKSGNIQIVEADKAYDDWKQNNGELNIIKSELILDGGAVLINGKTAIVSTRVFADNKEWSIKKIKEELIKTLNLDKIIFIPEHTYDFTGHVDGMVRFVDENTFLINNLEAEYRLADEEKKKPRGKLILQWIAAFESVIYNSGLNIKISIYKAEMNTGSDANGVYMNYLKFDKYIFMPVFGGDLKDSDKEAEKRFKKVFNNYRIITIKADKLAKKGGIINCVTWEK